MTQTATTTEAHVASHYDSDYDDLLRRVSARFVENIRDGVPLFITDADLWDIYLGGFTDPADRQHHDCHACRNFLTRFGGLVTIDDTGTITPAFWSADDAPALYTMPVHAMIRVIRRAKVTGVFLSADRVWGLPETGEWHHFSVTPPPSMLYRGTIQTATQKMAEKHEDFVTVIRALSEFTTAHLELALTLLKSDALYRSEKVLGQAEWLYTLHTSRAETRNGTCKANMIWKAVATAPAGFCHPRSSMIGTLLEDIAAGMSFETVSRRFADKMHPLSYQAAPTTGAIAAAEKVVAQLGAAGSLARRFARLDEVVALWTPTSAVDVPKSAGVFGYLIPKGKQRPATIMVVPTQTMTWDKFQREVLPTAERIEFRAPASGSYSALVTAVHPDAPPILQWDREEQRNPVSWYFWNGGSTAASFGLKAGTFVPVDAITLKPSMWYGGNAHQGSGVMFILSGAHDTRMAGAAIFPEILRTEFHGIRSVIEAYSRSAEIAGLKEPHAAGIMLDKGSGHWDVVLRVWAGTHPMDYRLDRWD